MCTFYFLEVVKMGDMSPGVVGGSNWAWTVYFEQTGRNKRQKEPEKRRQIN